MILATPNLHQFEVEASEFYSKRSRSEYVAQVEPAKHKRPQFAYNRKILPIGNVLLRLTKTPQVAINPGGKDCEVLGWGITIQTSIVENIPNEMARRFFELFSKADAGHLQEHEQQNWAEILEQVDFQAFSIDRAAPHYLEGTVVRLEPVCLVEWHDGQRQKIGRHVASALGCLRPGDEFGAYVKLGKDNDIRAIERIKLLSDAA